MSLHVKQAVAVIAWSVSGHFAFGDSLYDELSAKLRSHVPSSGGISCVYVPQDPAAIGEVLAGYESDSGAWYIVQPQMVLGTDSSGRSFSGPPARISDVQYTKGGAKLEQDDMDAYIGQCFISDIIRRGSEFYNVRRDGPAGYAVSATGVLGKRSLEMESITPEYRAQASLGLWEAFFDAKGVPLRVHRSWEGGSQDIVFQWSTRVPKPWLVNDGAHNFVLASFSSVGEKNLFDKTAVVASGLDSVVRMEKSKQFVAQQILTKRGESLGTNSKIAGAEPPAHRSLVARALLAAGLLGLAVAAVWIWRRRAAGA